MNSPSSIGEREKRQHSRSSLVVAVTTLLVVAHLTLVSSFVVVSGKIPTRTFSAVAEDEDEVSRQLSRAKEMVAAAKAKMASASKTTTPTPTPQTNNEKGEPDVSLFFAQVQGTDKAKSITTRDAVIKTRDEETGLITTDGELMATLSESEEWVARPLLIDEPQDLDEDELVYALADKQLNSRDVIANIHNLRKTMKTEDYKEIFDKKNFFIGEDI